ncbi:helix-turn-helix domain-containing protein [Streptomyces sp. NPDC052225]|uniref:helix-turn-helix domain-containing protein n=1 Tax=Streptomyces sp. NPDC052225 TaxID=3154949 RepID=UPI00342222FE
MSVRADDLPVPAADSPPAGLVTVARFDERPGYRVERPDGSRSALLLWTTGGAGEVWQGAVHRVLEPGTLAVLGPDVPQRYRIASGAGHWTLWWAHCRLRPLWTRRLRDHHLGDGVQVTGTLSAAVRDRITAAFREAHADASYPVAPGPGPHPARVAVARTETARELALGRLEQAVLLATDRPRGPLDPRLAHVLDVIAADPGAEHTVASLAATVALSPSRLAHLFSGELGSTPMRTLRDARLAHAAHLLEATGLPVDRVAAASGFASPFHFSRAFRTRYGMPPATYRRTLHTP